jgi:uncharacterized membrane protein
MDGMSMERLSDAMGSSITTIEDYYKHIEIKRLAGEYNGHTKRKQEESNSELLAELVRLKKEVVQLKADKRGEKGVLKIIERQRSTISRHKLDIVIRLGQQ